MEKYTIYPADGEKFVIEDVEAAAKLAGTIDDKIRAQLAQIPVEISDRAGYVVPVVDGELVVPNGASGTVRVREFYAYRSPNGAETTQALTGVYYAGSIETPPTPLPLAANHRWDLLYARVSETDSDGVSHMVEDPVTETVAVQTINTRHKGVVTLAWIQGTAASTGTDPYPPANWPATPAPAANEAIVPLAYVHTQSSGTPATVTYTIHKIQNVAPVAKMNPMGGLERVSSAPFILDGAGVCISADAKTIVTGGTVANGYWPIADGANRPVRALSPMSGGEKIWIPLIFGGTPIGSSWVIFSAAPIATPAPGALNKYNPQDWRNRWFRGSLELSNTVGGTPKMAHDFSAVAATGAFPTTMPYSSGNLWGGTGFSDANFENAQIAAWRWGSGNSIRENDDFNTESATTGWRVACMWRGLDGNLTNNDLALLVNTSTGALHLAAREATAGTIDGKIGMIVLEASPALMAFGL